MHIIELASNTYLKDDGGRLPTTSSVNEARTFNTLKQAQRALGRIQKQSDAFPDAKATPARKAA